jgi:site-specific DNA recombinase
VPRVEMIQVYKIVLIQQFKIQSKTKYETHKQVAEQINELNNKLSKARNLLVSETIDASDYRLIKIETEDEIRRLEAKLSSDSIKHLNIDSMVDKAVNTFSRLDHLYLNSNIIRKREIISSIFPEKLIFDGYSYRTTRLNEAAQLIYKLGKGFVKNKKEQIGHYSEMFPKVTPQRLELWTR